MRRMTKYVDKNGIRLLEGDYVKLDKFNGIYDFEGVCQIVFDPVLKPFGDEVDTRGFNGFSVESYLDKEKEHSKATKIASPLDVNVEILNNHQQAQP